MHGDAGVQPPNRAQGNRRSRPARSARTYYNVCPDVGADAGRMRLGCVVIAGPQSAGRCFASGCSAGRPARLNDDSFQRKRWCGQHRCLAKAIAPRRIPRRFSATRYCRTRVAKRCCGVALRGRPGSRYSLSKQVAHRRVQRRFCGVRSRGAGRDGDAHRRHAERIRAASAEHLYGFGPALRSARRSAELRGAPAACSTRACCS
jgi:hypothetical protein